MSRVLLIPLSQPNSSKKTFYDQINELINVEWIHEWVRIWTNSFSWGVYLTFSSLESPMILSYVHSFCHSNCIAKTAIFVCVIFYKFDIISDLERRAPPFITFITSRCSSACASCFCNLGNTKTQIQMPIYTYIHIYIYVNIQLQRDINTIADNLGKFGKTTTEGLTYAFKSRAIQDTMINIWRSKTPLNNDQHMEK